MVLAPCICTILNCIFEIFIVHVHVLSIVIDPSFMIIITEDTLKCHMKQFSCHFFLPFQGSKVGNLSCLSVCLSVCLDLLASICAQLYNTIRHLCTIWCNLSWHMMPCDVLAWHHDATTSLYLDVLWQLLDMLRDGVSMPRHFPIQRFIPFSKSNSITDQFNYMCLFKIVSMSMILSL